MWTPVSFTLTPRRSLLHPPSVQTFDITHNFFNITHAFHTHSQPIPSTPPDCSLLDDSDHSLSVEIPQRYTDNSTSNNLTHHSTTPCHNIQVTQPQLTQPSTSAILALHIVQRHQLNFKQRSLEQAASDSNATSHPQRFFTALTTTHSA
eukprot:Blabericola_migrator_1__1088@NODE_1278_length_4909_cov_41_248451_g863_i0_p2_GENE_NODE_1278_length_4909_cov_41_248451_g863_i0NODE_1278_length_4909_cov_41_248451_g863_i0_p2_ORF_typecomplete_len149_score18_32_NODE_1278_length_4909_cov_41_248451_g863_i0378824